MVTIHINVFCFGIMVTRRIPNCAPICHTNYGHKSFELILFWNYGHTSHPYLRANLLDQVWSRIQWTYSIFNLWSRGHPLICAPICHTNYGNESFDLILFLNYGHAANPYLRSNLPPNYGHDSFELILFWNYGHASHPNCAQICHTNYGNLIIIIIIHIFIYSL